MPCSHSRAQPVAYNHEWERNFLSVLKTQRKKICPSIIFPDNEQQYLCHIGSNPTSFSTILHDEDPGKAHIFLFFPSRDDQIFAVHTGSKTSTHTYAHGLA